MEGMGEIVTIGQNSQLFLEEDPFSIAEASSAHKDKVPCEV